MDETYLDFDVTVVREGAAYRVRVDAAPGATTNAGFEEAFELPFAPTELARFMVAVGPPRATSRRLAPVASRVPDVRDYGARLGDALLTGEVGRAYKDALRQATALGRNLRLRLRLDQAPELDPVPWEYLYDRQLDRFLALSRQTPIVRLLDALEQPAPVTVEPPLRVLVLISSPSDLPELAVDREAQLLQATTGDLVAAGQLELVLLSQATLGALQRALLEEFHVFHFIGHGGFDQETQEGVLVLEREDGTAHRVSGSRLGTLLHDARGLQLAVLNACEGARTSGRDAFSGVAQELVRRGLPAVVAMQTEISDRAALVFAHEFYSFLTRGLPIDEVMSEVRKAMAVSDEAAEWGTAVLLRSRASQPFAVKAASGAAPGREQRWEALYRGAQSALAANTPATALTMLEQLEAERPDYRDVTQLIQRIAPEEAADATASDPLPPEPDGPPAPTPPAPTPPAPTSPAPTPAPPPSPRRGLLLGAAAGVVALVIAGVALKPWIFPDAPVTPTTSASSAPTSASSAPTTAPDAVTLACGPAAAQPPGARDLTASCATKAPVVDGDLGEWAGARTVTVRTEVAPTLGAVPGDLAAAWNLRWDREALYAAVVVRDPALRPVDVAQPDQFWRGDSVSFEFGPAAEGLSPRATTRDGRDRHVMIGVGPNGAVASVNIAGTGSFPPGRVEPRIAAVVVTSDTGYRVEARIPWEVLAVDAPARGQVYAANLNVSDAAASRSWAFGRMVSSNPQRTGANQLRPGTWQSLVLADG